MHPGVIAMSYPLNLTASERDLDADELALEDLARRAYDAAHLNDSFSALKERARFSKEASGLYRGWMRAARSGALDVDSEKRSQPEAKTEPTALAA
jgi:hypothetical protein